MTAMTKRRVCHFSCGATSAVAAKLTLAKYGKDNVVVVNAFVKEEDADNRRFLADVEKWLGVPITVLRDVKYGASAFEVFRRNRFIKGPNGAKCSSVLKRQLLNAWSLPGDIPVIGYDTSRRDLVRADNYLADHPDAEFPLIELGIGKSDALAIVERAGLVLPMMYALGYNNANCIGCPKGGMGYWNRIRVDFPHTFEEMAKLEEAIGESAYLFRDRKTDQRISLRQLPPDAGRHDEPLIECGMACERAEDMIEGGA